MFVVMNKFLLTDFLSSSFAEENLFGLVLIPITESTAYHHVQSFEKQKKKAKVLRQYIAVIIGNATLESSKSLQPCDLSSTVSTAREVCCLSGATNQCGNLLKHFCGPTV